MKRTILLSALMGGVVWGACAQSAAPEIVSLRPGEDLPAAILKIRAARQAGTLASNRVVRIELAAGTYRLAQPLVLTAADSHLRIVSAQTGAAVLSGGIELPPFVEKAPGLWRTTPPDSRTFGQLWVNGRFARVARTPNSGFAYMASPCEEALDPQTGKIVDLSRRAFVCGPEEVALLAGEAAHGDLSRVGLRIYQMWVMGLHRIASFNPTDRVVRITPATKRPTLNGWGLTTRYALENLRAALDAPGEWYRDVRAGEILYLPREGETLATARAVVPATTKLLQVSGRDIAFRGVAFANCGLDDAVGFVGEQAQERDPAAIELTDAEDVDFASCSFRCLAPICVRVGAGCRRISVSGSFFDEFGIGGVHIGSWVRGERPTSFVSVTDSVLRGGGRVLEGGVGVWIGFATDVDICHNEICDLGYTGISSGWVWGYAATPTARIRLNDNYIHDLGHGVLSDMGGIYTLGNHPDSEVIGNRIHDIWSSDVDGRGGWGLYADEGTSGVRFESNLVYRTKTGSFHQHYGRENVIRNNIFADAREFPIERTRIENHQSFVCENNIVIWTNETQAVRSRQPGDLAKTTKGEVFDRNIYFNPNGVGEKAFHGFSFAAWQAGGMDKSGLVADPRLEDPASGRWMPAADSPAWRLGFKPFDPSAAGVRAATPDPAWAGLVPRRVAKPSLAPPLPLTYRGTYVNDFEGYADRARPLPFKYQCPTNAAGKGGAWVVPTSAARRGHVLEFADAAGLPQRGVPHVSGYFGATSDVYSIAFSVCAETGAEMDFSVRGPTPDFLFGVLVNYAGGRVNVNGQPLVDVPADTWWCLSVSVDLNAAERLWRVAVSRDGLAPVTTAVPSKDPKCRVPGWFGWNSNAEKDVKFWIDDLVIRTE